MNEYLKYQNKYLELKYNQIGGVYNEDKTKNRLLKSDRGAGVILVELYYDYKIEKYKPCILLFKNKFFGMYEDLGGGRDKNESIKECAMRESREESRNLFILPDKLFDENKAVRIGNYVGYIIHIRGPDDTNINLKYYTNNKNIILKHLEGKDNPSKIELSYNETLGVRRIYVDQIIKDNIKNFNNDDEDKDFETKDIDGKTIKIFSRAARILKTALQNKLIYTKEYFELYEGMFRANKDKYAFLNKTKFYH